MRKITALLILIAMFFVFRTEVVAESCVNWCTPICEGVAEDGSCLRYFTLCCDQGTEEWRSCNSCFYACGTDYWSGCCGPIDGCNDGGGGGGGCECGAAENGDCNPCNTCGTSAPTSPVLISPVDNLQLAEGFVSSPSAITFIWNPVTNWGENCSGNGTKLYTLYVDKGNINIFQKTFDSSITSYVYNASDYTQNTNYYWRVVADNGAQTASSTQRVFTSAADVSGILFDTTLGNDCSTIVSAPKIPGGSVIFSGGKIYTVSIDGKGVYSRILLSPGNYATSFSGFGYIDTPLYCLGSSTLSLTGNQSVTVANYGFRRLYGSWWQVTGGDVYANYIENEIPYSLPETERLLILSNDDGQSGLVSYADKLFLGQVYGAKVSDWGWEVNSKYEGKQLDYSYFKMKTSLLPKTIWEGNGRPAFSPDENSDYEVFVHEGDVNLNNGSDEFVVNSGEKMIFLVDGNVVVSGNVRVDKGGFLVVIASGQVSFESNVTEVDGWFMGNTLAVNSNGSGNFDDVDFKGSGSFVGWDNIKLNRNRGLMDNTEPSIRFYSRPDLMLNAPEIMKYSNFKWSESAP